jgi:hypothetical protein
MESNESDNARVAFSGEVWTDARGYATVALPRAVGRLHGDFTYELRPYTAAVAAVVAAELIDGRFTIATDEPHVKVAWRVSAPHPELRPERAEAREPGIPNP